MTPAPRLHLVRPAHLLFLGAALWLAACSHKIGDSCKTSIDCSPDGDRLCDISQPGGYCTFDFCDEKSCPKESACIRYFPRLDLIKPCKTQDDCTPDELCLPEGRCAERVSERRYCAFSCGDNGDCRGGYECREAGTHATLALTAEPNVTVHFCAPVDK